MFLGKQGYVTAEEFVNDLAVRSLTHDPEQSVLTEAERRQMLVDWNDTTVAYAEANFGLHQLIEAQAERTPNGAALVFEQQRLSYAELDRRANRLAHHLKRCGVGPDSLVGLFIERSLEMMVGILGILKAGAAYVPMDAAFPQERIAFMLADANVTSLLTQTSLLRSLPASTPQAVCLDSFDWADADEATQDDAHFHPGNLAYVIYTSGSTGRPKGVCIEHGNIVNYVLGVAERLQFKPGMNHATVSTIAADLGNTVIFPALITGGCLHIISQERIESPAKLADYFERENIDVLKIVPSHLAALQTWKNPEKVMPRRRLVLGGEASRLDLIERLRVLSPNCEIYNHYGPTETTVGVLTYRVDSQLHRTPSGTLPLGRPLPNTRIYILDQQGQPVPVGVEGELCIGGRGVARGYLNRPDLTAEKFVLSPISPGERLYRTGDLVRYLPDGNIEFCGRKDHQIKIHGHRIELGEIESALREHRGVRDAVVLAREDETDNKQLAAYVVPKRVHQPLWQTQAIYLLPDGSPVAHLNKNETDYIYKEIFVLQAYLRHGITVRDGDFIVDAGANIGLFTVFVNRMARNLRTIAFEPNPAAFACLKANAEAYGAGVKCLAFGLSNENKSAELTFFEGMSLLSGFYADRTTEREMVKNYVLNQQPELLKNGHLAERVEEVIDGRLHTRTELVQLRFLSSVMAEEGFHDIDLLKINVEKSEWDVLRGISPRDWPKIRQLIVEVDQQKNLAPITGLLKQHGYEVLVEQDPLLRNTELCYVYAIRTSALGRLIRQQSADAHIRSLPPVDEQILTRPTLHRHLRNSLPHYMIPSAFVLLQSFPLTSNGKIDRKALPPPDKQRVEVTREFVAPRDALEHALVRIWSKILKVKRIGLHDDFFELGGHSLAAIRLLSEVENLTAKTLPVATLFRAATVAALADILRADGWTPSWSSLVPIQPLGSKSPLFLVHGAEGNVLLYRQLTHYLGPDQPVYGLQSQGLSGDGRFNSTVEEMASHYLKEIVTVQPHGPYLLGGYCLGGFIAFELAQQLIALGEKVEAVILLDTYNISKVSRPKALLCAPVNLIQNVWFHFGNCVSIRGKDRGKFLREKLDIALTRLGIRFRAAAHALHRLVRSKATHRYPHLALKKINDGAAWRYVPRLYRGRVILIRPAGYFSGFSSQSFGWEDVVRGQFLIHELGVYPKGMLVEPFCRQLANTLRKYLQNESRSPNELASRN